MVSIIDTKVRVFISSTFKDMHAERDHLVTVVFPELRERLERLGLELYDVDLRWGVPETGVDGEKANPWEYCRKWIDRVEPFFICILGQRYGYIPDSFDIKDKDDRSVFEKISITEMEIRHGVLTGRHSKQSSFYFRDAVVPTDVPSDVYETFVDSSEQDRLKKLKSEIREYTTKTFRPAWDYPCTWTGSGFTDLGAFGNLVLEDLWSGVLRDQRFIAKNVWEKVLGHNPDDDFLYTDHSTSIPPEIADQIIAFAKPEPIDPLDAEAEQMAMFAEARLRFFQGREKELKELTDFINDQNPEASRICIVTALPGQGKSALLAKFSTLVPQSTLLIAHFIGATERSADARSLLERLVNELDRKGMPHPEENEQLLDLENLRKRLADRLENYDGDRRVVILIDAVNQLTTGHDLTWLPMRLGVGVRIILSSIVEPESVQDSPQERVLMAIEKRLTKPFQIKLSALDGNDVREIIKNYLEERCKVLDQDQINAIVQLKQARTPLYLIVMLRELCTMGGDDMHRKVLEIIGTLEHTCPDTVALFEWVLSGLEKAYGGEQVGAWCGYLALGRVGMAGVELRDLLRRTQGEEAACQALRIERGIRAYLQKRGGQWDYYHNELRTAAWRRYRLDENKLLMHREIAVYFGEKWREPNTHAISELPYHLAKGEEWAKVEDTLTDLNFIAAKCKEGIVFELVNDYRLALEVIPENQEILQQERNRQTRLQKWTDEIIAYSRAWSERRDQQARGEVVESSQPQLPDPSNSCSRWSDTEIDAAHQRLIEYPTSLDRLNSFAKFVKSECYQLQQFGKREGFTIQHAFNHAPVGPVHIASAGMLPICKTPIIIQCWPQNAIYNPMPALLSTLKGHVAEVMSVSMTPDGRRAISGSCDKTIRVWDLESGFCIRTLEGHSDWVWSVNITPDGKCAVSSSEDKTLRVWDLESGECLRLLSLEGQSKKKFGNVSCTHGSEYILDEAIQIMHRHSERVWCVSVTPNGRWAVSGSDDDALRVWDLERGTCLHVLEGHNSGIRCVSMTPDGRRAVSGSHDCDLRVWDIESGVCLWTLEGHNDKIRSVSVTPDGRCALTGSEDKTLRVWDLENGTCLRTLYGHSEAVTSVSVTADGRRAVSGSKDNLLRLWDLEIGVCLHTFEGHRALVESVSIGLEAHCAISGEGGTLLLWNLENGVCVRSLEGDGDGVRCLFVAPDVMRAVSGGMDNNLRVWDLESGKCLHTLEGHSDIIWDVSSTLDGRRAISGSRDKTVRVWDIGSQTCLRTLEGHSADVKVVCLTSDGCRAVSGSEDKTLRVWDVEKGECLFELENHSRVWCIRVTPNGRIAVSSADEFSQPLRVWDLENGTCLRNLEGHKGNVWCISLTSDGRRVVSGSEDKTLKVWDLESGVCLKTLEGHSARIWAVCLTIDGKRAISGSLDSTIRVWDLDSGMCIRTLVGHSSWVQEVLVTADGRFVVSGSYDKTIRVWDLTSGVCLAVLPTFGLRGSLSIVSNRIVGINSGTLLLAKIRSFEYGPELKPDLAIESYELILRRGLEYVSREKGKAHEETLAYLTALAVHLAKMGKPAEASDLAKERDLIDSKIRDHPKN
ncbi:MAG: DUF4062 domain-containing protein [Desulfuromonadaceae bacterium]|nr:DUF4062 domain-containing protein [Desulfuromonadaceae bacterium]